MKSWDWPLVTFWTVALIFCAAVEAAVALFIFRTV